MLCVLLHFADAWREFVNQNDHVNKDKQWLVQFCTDYNLVPLKNNFLWKYNMYMEEGDKCYSMMNFHQMNTPV